jgi:hypothetical protein
VPLLPRFSPINRDISGGAPIFSYTLQKSAKRFRFANRAGKKELKIESPLVASVDGGPSEILQNVRGNIQQQIDTLIQSTDLCVHFHPPGGLPRPCFFRPLIYAPGHLNGGRKVLSNGLKKSAQRPL